MTISDQIPQYAASGLSTAEIGRRLGVSREWIRRLINSTGNRQIYEQARLAAKTQAMAPSPWITRLCKYCGRDGLDKKYLSHQECSRAVYNYFKRIENGDRYRNDPAYRLYLAQWQRTNKARVSAANRRWYHKSRQSKDRNDE